MTTSIEFCTEGRFFNSRLEFDFTYYKTNTKNQLFTVDAPSGSQYARYYINAGDIQNTGVEVMLNGTLVMTKAGSYTHLIKQNLIRHGKNTNKIREAHSFWRNIFNHGAI